MGWFKRNLFFAIGVVAALLLLGLSGYYIWAQMARNNEKLTKLNEIYTALQGVKPGTDKSENIDAAKAQA
ncbi:MAG TPA: hypothetical protein VN516_07160, partial [Candidatus Baltobacteraceae bacterium]|nr:hypothetical protein [Candidatus Baltobacteraceae bacterium]